MKVEHVGLSVSDLDRSVRFYCEVIGFRLLRRTPINAYLYYEPDDLLELVQSNRPEPPSLPEGNEAWKAHMFGPVGLNHIGIRVDSMEEAVERLRARGARQVVDAFEFTPEVDFVADVSSDKLLRAAQPPQRGGSWRVAVFVDPDGIMIELLER